MAYQVYAIMAMTEVQNELGIAENLMYPLRKTDSEAGNSRKPELKVSRIVSMDKEERNSPKIPSIINLSFRSGNIRGAGSELCGATGGTFPGTGA